MVLKIFKIEIFLIKNLKKLRKSAGKVPGFAEKVPEIN